MCLFQSALHLESGLAPLFEDLRQSEKLSEIKPPFRAYILKIEHSLIPMWTLPLKLVFRNYDATAFNCITLICISFKLPRVYFYFKIAIMIKSFQFEKTLKITLQLQLLTFLEITTLLSIQVHSFA